MNKDNMIKTVANNVAQALQPVSGNVAQATSPVHRRTLRTGGVASATLSLMLASAANATTWHVSTNGNDTAAGTSWTTAFRTIQKAINVAAANDTIIVTNGVYAPILSDNKSYIGKRKKTKGFFISTQRFGNT